VCSNSNDPIELFLCLHSVRRADAIGELSANDESVARMPGWVGRRIARAPENQRGDSAALVGLIVLAVAVAFYGYRHWHGQPLIGGAWYKPWDAKPLVGAALVVDGDSLEISGARIRLIGIDAPEMHQTCTDARRETWPCGRAAARELRAHIGDRALKCEQTGLDRYRRVLAVCFLPDGSDVNAWMVRQGWAVVFGYGPNYRAEQAEAKAARRGIWAGTFTMPAEWRQRH
jgi:endonuclease YncB( thermonuclease family)